MYDLALLLVSCRKIEFSSMAAVLLGLCDEPIPEGTELDWSVNKIGGNPVSNAYSHLLYGCRLYDDVPISEN